MENINPVQAADKVEGYTDAEIASTLPRNMLEIINILTNYKNADDPNGEFQKIWTTLGGNALGPDRLLGILERSLGRRLDPAPAGAPLTMDTFSARLQQTVHNNNIDAGRFGESTIGMVREFNTWSKSI